jgi:hypothetical protein
MAAAMITTQQVRMIRSLVHKRLGWDDEQYHQWLSDRGGPASTLGLRRAEAANLIDLLLDLANGRSPRVWRLDGATLLQRQQIADLAAEAGLAEDDLGGVIRRVTRGRHNTVAPCSIHEARGVVEALRAIGRRNRRSA